MSGHGVLPKGDYTVVANYFFDYIMPRVTAAEWKIICAVIRETFGWRCDIATHPESCRRLEAEITIERFKVLTGFASQALVAAIKKACSRGVVRRRPQQNGRQRTFRFSTVPRANLKSLKPKLVITQEILPFSSESDFENQNPLPSDGLSKIKIPNGACDFENQNPVGAVLISVKKDQDLKKNTHTENAAAEPSVCVNQIIDRRRYKAYAIAQPGIVDPTAWATTAERTRQWDSDVLEWEEAERAKEARRSELEKQRKAELENQRLEFEAWRSRTAEQKPDASESTTAGAVAIELAETPEQKLARETHETKERQARERGEQMLADIRDKAKQRKLGTG